MNENELLKSGYRKYTGKNVDVFFNTNICQHAGNCVKGCPSVFNIHEKPWINLQDVDMQKLETTINTCPSGALKFIKKNEE